MHAESGTGPSRSNAASATGPGEGEPAQASSPEWTFIHLVNNLEMKRIVDPAQRRTIRSHAMRRVRFSESIKGIKRPSGRESNRTKGQLARAEWLLGPVYQDILEIYGEDGMLPEHMQRELERYCYHLPLRWLSAPPPGANFLDPFGTLPGQERPSEFLDRLLHHCGSPIDSRTIGSH